MRKHPLLLLILLYFLVRLPNLTKLPIFTDETNYLDWGWREIHIPHNLWYSLYDAKPPLIMWLYGLSQTLISDPLLAGRLVSVIIGVTVLLGIYNVAPLASLLYIFIPLFHLYDRQALMENSLAAIFIWSFYFLDNPLFLGVLLGLGLLIKPTAWLFIATYLLVGIFKKPWAGDFGHSFLRYLLAPFIALLVALPMFLQPLFQKNFSLSGQYIHLPNWQIFTNTLTTGDIIFWQLTPLVCIFICLGLWKSGKKHVRLILWIGIPLLIQILVAKFLISRYLLPFLPPLTIFAGIGLRKFFRPWIFVLVFSLPIYLTLLQTFNPPQYFSQLSRFTPNTYLGGYVGSEAAGYNIQNALQYFSRLAQNQSFFLGVGLYSGNPEAAFIIYFRNHPHITVGYLDAKLLTNISGYDCLAFDQPVYLATRDPQAAGLSKFMEPVTVITNIYNDSKIYIFRLKTNCIGKTFRLQITSSKTI